MDAAEGAANDGTGLQRAGALLLATGVGLGAFGAHFLDGRITADAMGTFETAVLYQLVHGVGILAAGFAIRGGQSGLAGPARLLLGAVLLFVTVLYALAFGGPRFLGAVAPLGGTGMILGWLWLAARVGRD